jgi:hypothetical protein
LNHWKEKEEILVSNHHFLLFQDFGPTVVNNVKQLPLCLDVNNSGAEYAKIGIDVLQEPN